MVRVAVIDNEADFVDLVAQALDERQWVVSGYIGEARCLSSLRREQPDVILLDLRLGGSLTGWDYLAMFEADPVLHATPVIVCSAARNELQAESARLDGLRIQVLEKPFDLDALFGAVDRALTLRAIKTVTA